MKYPINTPKIEAHPLLTGEMIENQVAMYNLIHWRMQEVRGKVKDEVINSTKKPPHAIMNHL